MRPRPLHMPFTVSYQTERLDTRATLEEIAVARFVSRGNAIAYALDARDRFPSRDRAHGRRWLVRKNDKIIHATG